MKASVNGININYDVSGKGNWLTLIHGAGDNSAIWYNQLHLFSQDHKLVTLDMRGHGASDVPDGQYDMQAYIEDLNGLLDRLNVDRTVLLGHSLGGAVALTYSVRHADRVSALIISNTPSGTNYRGKPANRPGQPPIMDISEAAQRRTRLFFTADFAAANKATMEHYLSIYMKSSHEGHIKVADQMRQVIASQPSPEELKSISCPVLMITGSADRIAGPQSAQQLRAYIPQLQIEVLPTGHYPAIEQPDRFNSIALGFLKKHCI